MRTRRFVNVAMMASVIALAAPAAAQHQGHTMPGTQPQAPEQAAACAQNQQQISALIDQVSERIEDARQTNHPSEMRAAIADLQGALATTKRLLQPCAALAAAPAGQPGGHSMEGGTSGPPTMNPGSRPASAETDPVCRMKVDPAQAPKATYKGRDYYFCSHQDREKFLKDPDAYLQKPR